MIQDMHKAE